MVGRRVELAARRRGQATKRRHEASSLVGTPGPLDDGSYSLRLVAVLSDGSELFGEQVSVLVDNVGPEIHLREPIEGQTLSGFVSIALEAEDSVSDVSVVVLEISGGGEDWRRIAETRGRPFELRWSSEALPDGDYRLRIDARDGKRQSQSDRSVRGRDSQRARRRRAGRPR